MLEQPAADEDHQLADRTLAGPLPRGPRSARRPARERSAASRQAGRGEDAAILDTPLKRRTARQSWGRSWHRPPPAGRSCRRAAHARNPSPGRTTKLPCKAGWAMIGSGMLLVSATPAGVQATDAGTDQQPSVRRLAGPAGHDAASLRAAVTLAESERPPVCRLAFATAAVQRSDAPRKGKTSDWSGHDRP